MIQNESTDQTFTCCMTLCPRNKGKSLYHVWYTIVNLSEIITNKSTKALVYLDTMCNEVCMVIIDMA